MPPIFISDSSHHRELTRQLAAVLEAQHGPGSVWWDHELESRGSYAQQIRAALEKARVVIVTWTAGAQVSDYVYAEAVTAQGLGKLVNVRPADTAFRDIPEPFNIRHIDDLADTEGILATVAKVMQGIPLPTRVPLHEIFRRQHGVAVFDAKRAPRCAPGRPLSPAELLQARHGVVPYLDATGLLARLLAWARQPEPAACGLLLHGPGGQGKTRLAIELCAARGTQGWTAGFFERAHLADSDLLRQRWQALQQLLDFPEGQGLLLVVDYAEGRQDEVRRLAEDLSRRAAAQRPLLRIVLLARTTGEWWQRLVDESLDMQRLFTPTSGGPEVLALPAIAAGADGARLFERAVQACAAALCAEGSKVATGAACSACTARASTAWRPSSPTRSANT